MLREFGETAARILQDSGAKMIKLCRTSCLCLDGHGPPQSKVGRHARRDSAHSAGRRPARAQRLLENNFYGFKAHGAVSAAFIPCYSAAENRKGMHHNCDYLTGCWHLKAVMLCTAVHVIADIVGDSFDSDGIEQKYIMSK